MAIKWNWLFLLMTMIASGGIAAEQDSHEGTWTIKQMIADMVSKSKLMIWDGDMYPASPKAWTSPTMQVKAELSATVAHSGKRSLHIHSEGSQWTGFGWNFAGWWPPEKVWDLTAYQNLSFWIRIDAAAGKAPNKPNLHLLSANGKESATVDLLTYAANIMDGRWHEVVIPLDKFRNENFDMAAVWEISIGQWAPDNRVWDLYIDDIGADNRP